MKRPTRRQIGKRIERLENEGSRLRGGDGKTVYDRVSDPLAEFLKKLARDLMMVFTDYPDKIANAPEPDATKMYFQVVRDRYGIDEDRDEAVRRTLEAPPADPEMDVRSRFAMATSSVAERNEVTTPDGESLEQLVDEGRVDEAERVLVRATYDLLATARSR